MEHPNQHPNQHPQDDPVVPGLSFEPECVDPKQLREHPKQKLLFDEPSGDEIERVAQELFKTGHAQCIQIFSDHTILSGQLMVKAILRAGIKTCPALIRYDLGKWNEPESLLEFIKQYHKQHSLDEMTLGRCYRELRAAFLGDRQRLSDDAVIRIQVALQTEKSAATLEQLGRLAELPRFVQDLVASKRLSRRKANRIRLLDDELKAQVLEAISNGEPLKSVLARFDVTGKRAQQINRLKGSKASDPFSDPDHMAKLIAHAEYDHAIYREYLVDTVGLKPGQFPTLDDATSTPALRQLSFRQDR